MVEPQATNRSGPEELLTDGPVAKPTQWTRIVNGVETKMELNSLRSCVERGAPFEDPDWQTTTAERLALESSLRLRGRPRLNGEI